MKTKLNECINIETYEVNWNILNKFLKEAKEIYKKSMKLAKEEFDFELEDECELLKENYKKVKENMRYKKRNEEYKIDKSEMFHIINLLFCECTLCESAVWKHERDNKFKEINRRHEEIDEKNEMIKEREKIGGDIMALMDIERKDGIQIGGPLDYCYECSKREGRNNYGEMEYKECFVVTQNGMRKCFCMDCFKKMLGKYMLIDPTAAMEEMEK